MIGLADTGQDFFLLQQGNGLDGNFPSGMGAIYNGAVFGNTPTSIAATIDQGVFGVGVYIQSAYFGTFTASIELFDAGLQSLGVFSAAGLSDTVVGNALFVGA